MSSSKISHISIIMDGNGRWAKKIGMPRAFGHREGIKSINKIVSACSLRQIEELTLFAFSSENWKRPNHEVKFLLSLFEESIQKYVDDLHNNNVKVSFIGDMSRFSNHLLKNINDAETLTKDNTNLKLNFAINYGGKWDIINSFNKMLKSNHKSIQDKNVKEKDIEEFLSLNGSSPDLLIRTAGYNRLSNFMLWQHAYSEIYFTDCLWPDFDEQELDMAIKYYLKTTRKFGSLVDMNQPVKKDA
jgi:undecaprenyl diphosphate synthase